MMNEIKRRIFITYDIGKRREYILCIIFLLFTALFIWKDPENNFARNMQYTFLLIIISAISIASRLERHKSLKRAYASEEMLKEERRMLEKKVEERSRELKQLQIEKMSQLYRFIEFGRLSSGLFHDLMNPLTAVTLNVAKIENITGKATEIAEYARRAITASKRMEHFMDTVRRQMRTEEMEEYFSLNDEIDQAIELLHFKSRTEKVSVIFLAYTEIHSYGNPIKFHQIATNLISNAIDSYNGTNDSKTRTVIVRVGEKNGRVMFSVTDKGSGIPKEIKKKIFDPFFTTKHYFRGTGLGLSTTKAIVEKDFGGKITVKSSLYRGSVFTIRFSKKDLPNALPEPFSKGEID